jgi:hypothetical protein
MSLISLPYSARFGYLSEVSDSDKVEGVADQEESDSSIVPIKKPTNFGVVLFVL